MRTIVLSFLVVVTVLGCDGQTGPTAADTTSSPKPTFGQRCDVAVGCATGLTCQDSEFAPFPWCTAPCPTDKVKAYCDDPALGTLPGFCIQMPAGWRGPAEPFCAPTCAKLADCQGLDGKWEACGKPVYKQIELTSGEPTKVCQNPSSHGQIHVDPKTCDWEAKVTDPKFTEAKQVCKAWCDFMILCKLWDPKGSTTAKECCGWACFQYVTPGGVVDNQRLSSELKCFVKSHSANAGTDRVCSGPIEDCGTPPALQ